MILGSGGLEGSLELLAEHRALDVLGIGALNVDLWFQVKEYVQDAEVLVLESGESAGGSAANTIVALAKLGLRTGFAGVVGDDNWARLILRDFDRHRVDFRATIRKHGATGRAICVLEASGTRSILVAPGVNTDLRLEELAFPWPAVRVLHMSSFAEPRQVELLSSVADRFSRSTDIGYSPGALGSRLGIKALEPVLARTRFLFLNLDEFRALTGSASTDAAARLHDVGCQVVVVTRGSTEGPKWQISSDAGSVFGPTRQLVRGPLAADSLGAGDSFAAGFLLGMLRGQGYESSGMIGQVVAELTLNRPGARSGQPSLDQLTSVLGELSLADVLT